MVQDKTTSSPKKGSKISVEDLTKQLETLLAPKNIENDPALRKHASDDGTIAIDALVDMDAFKKNSADKEQLVEAISASAKLNLDPSNNFVTPVYERKTLILREIPTNTSKADIHKILASVDNWTCPAVVDMRADIGDNWFVTFKTEDDCLDAAMQLRLKGRFKGEKIAVRVKSQRMNIGATAGVQASKGAPKPPFGGYNPYAGRPPPHMSPNVGPYYPGSYSMAGGPVAPPSSDYPGDFFRFTPAAMVDIIKGAYGGKPPKKPDNLKRAEIKSLIRLHPQVFPLRLIKDAAGNAFPAKNKKVSASA